jgi:hypothetical protein
VKGGGVKTGRWDSVRRKECGRITCKRSESSRVSLKLQPLIKPVLSLDSVASPNCNRGRELWDYGLLFITKVAPNLSGPEDSETALVDR